MEHPRPSTERHRAHPPGGPMAALVVVAAVVAGIVALGTGAPSGVAPPPASTLDAGPEIDPEPDALEAGIAVVQELAAAWDAGDAETVEALISNDWAVISLPGFPDPSFRPGDGRAALRSGISFLVEVAGLELGSCAADRATARSRAESVVECPDASFTGDYLDAVRREERVGIEETTPGIWFGIHRGGIVALDDGDPHRFAPEAYCIWAEQFHPEEAEGLFDLSCRPNTDPDLGGRHARMAAAFAAAGEPEPAPELTALRLAASGVSRFVAAFNAGNDEDTGALLGPAVRASGLPGYAALGAAVERAPFLAWSSIVLDLDVGTCRVEVDARRATTLVTCGEALLRMPAAEGASSPPIAVEVRFTLRDGVIAAVESHTEDRLVEHLDELCTRLRRYRPLTASRTFEEDCRPVLTPAAAEELVAVVTGSR